MVGEQQRGEESEKEIVDIQKKAESQDQLCTCVSAQFGVQRSGT